jgi:hypothetical protein
VSGALKTTVAAMVVAVGGAACAPAGVTPTAVVPSAVASPAVSSPAVSGTPSAVASSAAVAPTTRPTPSQQTARLTVAGTALGLTVELPRGWGSFDYGADIGTSGPPAGMAFIVSAVDNTFADPCSHRQRSPKVGSTTADLAKALGEIPNTTATAPVQTTIAGHPATYMEIAIPASLPCAPSEFYLWQDSPGGYWWVQGLGETARVWILEVAGQRVAFVTHSYPGSGTEAKAVFKKILDSIVFDGGA